MRVIPPEVVRVAHGRATPRIRAPSEQSRADWALAEPGPSHHDSSHTKEQWWNEADWSSCGAGQVVGTDAETHSC